MRYACYTHSQAMWEEARYILPQFAIHVVQLQQGRITEQENEDTTKHDMSNTLEVHVM